MQTPSAKIYEFGEFRLDTAKRVLRRLDGTPVSLTPRVFETLLYMVEHHDAVLAKEQIMEAVWPDSIVEENNLAQAISKLRQVFGETPGSHNYIVTVPGRGYRFVAKVKELTGSSAPTANAERVTTEAPIQEALLKVAGDQVKGQYPHSAADTAASTGKKLFGAAIAAIVIVTLAVLLFIRYRSLPASVRAPSSPIPAATVLSAPTPIPEKSIAVLPFDNLSDDKQNAFFAAGVQDEIISDLARIADLKVISRTSANLYKSGNPRNSREIGQQLGVAHLLEGSVQRIGNRLRLNAQLIKVPTDTHVWAQTYDRDVADLFAIQSEIARAIADQLHAKISQAEKRAIERPPTTDLNAFDLYSRAKNLHLTVGFSTKAREDLLRAADLLNQAVSRDPSFFQAFCQLSQTHGLLYSYGFDHTSARLALAEAALATASRLHPDAGETHLARAWNLYVGYRDYDAALRELKLARESLPNDPQIFELTAYIQRRQGRWEESIHSLERTLELDPRNLDALHRIALRYRDLARYHEAKLALNRALAIDPNDVTTKAMCAVVELDWKADTRPLHELINELRVKDSAALQSVPDFWLTWALAERDPAAASDALAVLGENALSNGPIQLSRKFVEGLNARMVKDDSRARSDFTAARVEQEKIVERQPDYGPALSVLGLIDAALGRKEEALREGRRAVELLPVEKDAVNGRIMVAHFAMIAAWVGDNALACEQLAVAVRYTSSLSYGQLKLMPWWDPLRGDPCFEQIVASLVPNGS
jgi:TolB-like protein/DNA-binding winged helix-turn-helix (wHTH) protein/Tfp pilus assembly protein PilF